jgi:hypothetical protein
LPRCDALALAALLAVGCSHATPLFTSAAPYPPLEQRLRESGGDPARAVRVTALAQLYKLEPDRRYKYVVTQEGALVVAPVPAEPPNEYVHPVLARGQPVRTAGYLRVLHGPTGLVVSIDGDSKAYCPTQASVQAAQNALVDVGVREAWIDVLNNRPTCLQQGQPSAPGMMPPPK